MDISVGSDQAIGEHLLFLQEGDSPIGLDDAVKAHAAGKFTAAKSSVLSFGIGVRPVWIVLEAVNPNSSPAARRLLVETSWLDHVEVYFRRNGRTVQSHRTGDTQPFSQRPIDQRFFVFDHAFAPGTSTLFIRVATPDPMVVPIYLTDVEAARAREVGQGYLYGLMYGYLFALLAYNLMMYLNLRSIRYLQYSIYLFCFAAMNVSYTGHGFQWLWPNQTTWQLWSNPVLMTAYVVSGILFAARFVGTRELFPRLHRATIGICVGFAGLEALMVALGDHVAALLLAFAGIFLFTGYMVPMGVAAVHRGVISAKYFLSAAIVAAAGASVTAAAVWGLIPYNIWTYHMIEIGTLCDVTLLSLAIAAQFHANEQQKLTAERTAKIDPLTGMNNRRAFYDLAKSAWNTGIRNRHDMAVILFDLDRFKSINDTYGHFLGDAVLIQAARILLREVRKGDIPVRCGGEEFMLFLPETGLVQAVRIAERLRIEMADLRLEVDGKTLSFTASFGVACNSASQGSLDELIAAADRQLYAAKEQGRDRVSPALSASRPAESLV